MADGTSSIIGKIKEAIAKLPFNNLVGKIPALAKFSGYANYAACAVALVLVIAVLSPSGGGESGPVIKVTSQNILEKVSNMKKASTVQVNGFIDCQTLHWAAESAPFLIDIDLSKAQGLEVIKDGTFKNCKQLSGITLPASVTKLESWSMTNCPNLKTIRFAGTLAQWCTINISDIGTGWHNVTWRDNKQEISLYINGRQIKGTLNIPKGTEIINGTAFAGCTDITAVNFPDGIKEVWVNAFYGCTGLHSVTLPTGIKIEEGVFSKTNISKVVAAADIDSLSGRGSFEGCPDISLTITSGKTGIVDFYGIEIGTTVIVEKGVKEINGTIGGENLASVKLPDTLTKIGYEAFINKKKLISVTLPKSLTTINDNAFLGCGITSITIPKSVTFIGERAFVGCNDLSEVIFEEQGEWQVYDIGYSQERAKIGQPTQLGADPARDAEFLRKQEYAVEKL